MSRARSALIGGAIVSTAALAISSCGGRSASDRTLATIPDGGTLSAVGDWIAWSTHRRDGWHLVTLHDGHTSEPAIAPRHDAFDLDLGTDARGAPVAAFSRCRYHRVPEAQGGGIAPFACRLRAVGLAGGREHSTGVPEPAGASDSAPSMWRGRIAFARAAPGREADHPHIKLYDPATGAMRDLGIGPLGQSSFGNVLQMDLGPTQLAFAWAYFGGPNGTPATAIVAVRLRDGHHVLAGDGGTSEACMEGPDDIEVGSPLVHRGQILYVETDYTCYSGPSFLKRFDPVHRRLRSARGRGSLQQLASDGRRLYGLFAGASEDPEEEAPFCSPTQPCHLRVLNPPLGRLQPALTAKHD